MDFEKLYDKQFPIIYRYLTVLCGNPSLAEELTQETFYRAIEHSTSFRGKCKLSVGGKKPVRYLLNIILLMQK